MIGMAIALRQRLSSGLRRQASSAAIGAATGGRRFQSGTYCRICINGTKSSSSGGGGGRASEHQHGAQSSSPSLPPSLRTGFMAGLNGVLKKRMLSTSSSSSPSSVSSTPPIAAPASTTGEESNSAGMTGGHTGLQGLSSRGAKVWFPNMFMRLVSPPTKGRPVAKFRVPPKMTKWDVKEYLTKIYNLNVREVRTKNVAGQRKRFRGKSGYRYYRKPNYKEAFVFFVDNVWK